VIGLTKETCDQDPSCCFKKAVNSSLPGSFFSFEGLAVNRDLGSAVNVISRATVSVYRDGDAGNHPLPTSIQPNAWAAVSSLIPTSVPPLTTSVDVNAVPVTLSSDLPSSSSEPTPQAASVDGSSSQSESTIQATLEAKFQGEAHIGRRWKSRDHRSGMIHNRRMGNDRRQDQTVDATAPINTALGNLASSSPSLNPISILAAVSISFNHPLATSDATVSSPTQALTPSEEAIQRGFSAKLFAQQSPGMSRLGFKTQYVQDSLDAHGTNVILPGKEKFYREWFDKGLAHGEGLVQKVVARMNAV
jgi:hypothetical protein